MPLWALVIVGVVVVALLARAVMPLCARFFRRQVRSNDSQLFDDCGHSAKNIGFRLFALLPSAPRCAVCFVPFGGVGRALGATPSRKNPRLCSACFERAPVGGYPMDIGVLFVDIRGFTTLAEHEEPEAMATLLNRFYKVATGVLVERFAIIDKLIGDEVMALFLPQFRALGDRTREVMVEAAEDLLRGVGYEPGKTPWLPIGLGLHFGPAHVGNVGAGEVKDFTAIGDAVNVAARLQSKAGPGQIVVSETVYESVTARYPMSEMVSMQVKGREHPVPARILDPTAG
jgi:adenylate cyclase